MNIPVIKVEAPNLPAGWEIAVLETWKNGISIHTQYDKPGDPPSKDAFLVLSIDNPFDEPRIHRAMPGGIYDLEIYTQEVVDGIHDHWIDPENGKWSYTYNQRLTAYKTPMTLYHTDQLQYVVDTLADTPYSRRAQAITWQPWADTKDEHSPCLQRLHFRLVDNYLVMSAHMRSNDAFKAAFMNMYAFTALQKSIADRISEKCGRKIKVGQYNHVVDSFHIYGSYFEEFEGFLKSVSNRSWDDRTYWTSNVEEIFEEARERISKSK